MCYVMALAATGFSACGQPETGSSSGRSKNKAVAFQVPRDWAEAPGFEASPVEVEDFYLVYQSRDFQNLLVLPSGSDEAFVLQLLETAVYMIPRGRVVITGTGAEVTSARPEERGVFVRNGSDIVFDAGDQKIRVYPGAPMTGEIPVSTLLAKKKDYAEAVQDYRPDPVAVARLKETKKPLEIVVFFGTWCSTCRRHLPELIKGLVEADNPVLAVRYIAVDENLSTPKEEIERFRVHVTPTVVVLEGGREVGRLDGLPKSTLDKDLADLIWQNR